MKKNDWILAGIIIAAALGFFLWHSMNGQKGAETVTVRVDDKVYGTYDLSETQVIEINQTNTLTIEEGQARMTYADCPDQVCVHQKAVSKNRESIICLPNKVVVLIESGQENELDAVSQ